MCFMIMDFIALLAFTSPGLGLMNRSPGWVGQQLVFLPQCCFALVLSGWRITSFPCNGEQPVQAIRSQGGAQLYVPLTHHAGWRVLGFPGGDMCGKMYYRNREGGRLTHWDQNCFPWMDLLNTNREGRAQEPGWAFHRLVIPVSR